MKVGSTVVVCFAWLLMGLECTAKHMFQAKWHHHVIAQARVEDVTVVDGAYYFPKNSLRKRFFRASTETHMDKFGVANYYHLQELHPIHKVHVNVHKDSAYTFRDPNPGFEHIKGMVAFHRGVRIERHDIGDHEGDVHHDRHAEL